MARDLNIRLTENKPFYFISYNNNGDVQDARLTELLSLLDGFGFPMWYDNGIKTGTQWEKTLAMRIHDSEAVFLFISNQIFEKEKSYVQKEYEIARDYSKKKTIPVILDPIDKTAIPAQYQSWLVDVFHLQCIKVYDYPDLRVAAEEIMKAVDFRVSSDNVVPNQKNHNEYAEALIERFKTINSVFTLLDMDYLHSEAENSFVDLIELVQLFQEEREEDYLSSESIVNKQVRCIVYGDGGSGKTTFLQHKAYDIALLSRDSSNVIPLYIKLSECSEHTFDNMDSLFDVCRMSSQSYESGSKLILFLDALDEYSVDDLNRAASLFAKIQEFSDNCNCSYILTCRSEYVPSENSVQKYKISPLTRELSMSFTKRYFDFFGVKMDVQEYFSMLPAEVLILTSSPLILSMLIAQYIKTKTIPDNKDSLYKMIMLQLLEKKPIISDPAFNVGEKFYVLCNLAFNLLISGKLSFTLADAIKVIDERNTYNIPSKKILDDYIHSGILSLDNNSVSFFHTSILEFFSSQEISKEYSFVAKASMDQYFLRNAKKINLIIRCINPSTDDDIVEIGAGIGSVSIHLKHYRNLYLVDLDEGLCKILKYNFRHRESCEVICEDAIKFLRQTQCKKIISNLPFFMTKDVLNTLSTLDFSVAVLSVKEDDEFSDYDDVFDIEELGVLEEKDFFPEQPFKSRLIMVKRKSKAK